MVCPARFDVDSEDGREENGHNAMVIYMLTAREITGTWKKKLKMLELQCVTESNTVSQNENCLHVAVSG